MGSISYAKNCFVNKYRGTIILYISDFLQLGKIDLDETAVMAEEVTLNERPLDLALSSETNNIVGDGPAENILGLSPVQIQQEYFENLLDCDWVR